MPCRSCFELHSDPRRILQRQILELLRKRHENIRLLHVEVRRNPAEMAKIMSNNPSKLKGQNLPVENVKWYDAIQ